MIENAKGPKIFLVLWCVITLAWWALAFYPQKQDAQWLEVARQVCFGTLPNGLPDTYGWLLLLLGPASFLIGLFVTWGEELKNVFLNLFKSKKESFVLITVLSLTLLEASWVIDRLNKAKEMELVYSSTEKGPLPDGYPRTHKDLPSFELVDQNGSTIRNDSYLGNVYILTFAFAHCQTVCPMLVTNAMLSLKEVGSPHLKLLIITLDPWRDTPRSLPSLAKDWGLGEDAHILSGDVERVYDVIESLGIPTNRNEMNGDISHPSLTYIIDSKGKIAYTFNDAPVNWLILASKNLLQEL